MNSFLMWVTAVSAVPGGACKLFGNHFAPGKHFVDGLALTAPLISGMIGILHLSTLISKAVQFTIAPLFCPACPDLSIPAGIPAADMRGYPSAAETTAFIGSGLTGPASNVLFAGPALIRDRTGRTA